MNQPPPQQFPIYSPAFERGTYDPGDTQPTRARITGNQQRKQLYKVNKIANSGTTMMFYKSWVPNWLWLLDLLILVVIVTAIGVGESNNDAHKPWKMPVYRISDFTAHKAAVKKFAVIDQWTKSMSAMTVNTITNTLTHDVGYTASNLFPGFSTDQMTEFKYCVNVAAVNATLHDPTSAFSAGDTGIFKKIAWDCIRSVPTPPHITLFTTINILPILFIWAASSLAARSFVNLAMLRKAEEEEMNNGVHGPRSALTQFLALFSTLCAIAAIVYVIWENASNRPDFVIAHLILLFFVLASIMYSAVAVWKQFSSAYAPFKRYTGEHAEDYQVVWIISSFLKSLIVTPCYVCIVFALSGVTEFYSLLLAIILSLSLALVCSTISYANLYATFKEDNDAVPLVGPVNGPNSDTGKNRAADMRGAGGSNIKSKRPMNVILTALVIFFVLVFTSWPRRNDVSTLWSSEFFIFFLLVGLGLIVMADLVLHRRFGTAVLLREQAEMVFRIFITIVVVTYVF
eukprot:3266016-Rhodomonas_salina.4